MANPIHELDVLMCCGPMDVRYLFPLSLQCCLKHFTPLKRLTIVTPDIHAATATLSQAGLERESRIRILSDREVLPAHLREWPGWYRQQFIKLMADQVCGTPYVCCVGADTLILSPVGTKDLFSGTRPILFYNRYPRPAPHLAYERRRIANIARLLKVNPIRSLQLGDFIMDCTVFSSGTLASLRKYSESLYGEEGVASQLSRKCETLEEKEGFGEWSLYAVYTLDVLKEDVTIRNSRNTFVAQVHSHTDYSRFKFDSRVVHFVSKSFDVSHIREMLRKSGSI